MAQENVTVKLSTGGEAVLRGFVRIKDRRAVRRALFEGQTVSVSDDEMDESIEMSLANAMDVTDLKVERLLISFDGETEEPFEALMNSTSEEDYMAIQKAASTIFGDDKAVQEAKRKKASAGGKTTNES